MLEDGQAGRAQAVLDAPASQSWEERKMYFLAGLLLLLLGAGMLAFPKAVYALTESWKSRVPGEPSGLYLINVRVGGTAFCLVGAAAFVFLR